MNVFKGLGAVKKSLNIFQPQQKAESNNVDFSLFRETICLSALKCRVYDFFILLAAEKVLSFVKREHN